MLKISHWKKFLGKVIQSEPDLRVNSNHVPYVSLSNDAKDINAPQPNINPNTCKHDWSPEYDYKTYPGSVKVLESYCLKCGTPSRGSGQ